MTDADNSKTTGLTWHPSHSGERLRGAGGCASGSDSGNTKADSKGRSVTVSATSLEGSNSGSGVRLSLNLMKSLRRKAAAASAAASGGTSNNNSEIGSNNSSNIEGNNSDNSALVSLGNTSFGFNFDDSEEGMSNASPASPDQSDSDGGGGVAASGDAKGSVTASQNTKSSSSAIGSSQVGAGGNKDAGSAPGITGTASSAVSATVMDKTATTTATAASSSVKTSATAMATPGSTATLGSTSASTSTAMQQDAKSGSAGTTSEPAASEETRDSQGPRRNANSGSSQGGGSAAFHNLAAEAAVAELHSIASSSLCTQSQEEGAKDEDRQEEGRSSKKRSRFDESGGYNSDDESSRMASAGGNNTDEKPEDIKSNLSSQKEIVQASDDGGTVDSRGGKKKRLDDKKREERNAREKERSFRISKQINELRNLLSTGGVIVPKGTKSSVLTETANYIRMLQQHQYRAEIDRHQLVQQIQIIAGGAHGPQAAAAIRHVAAQNGVMSFDNIGVAPLKTASNNLQYAQQTNNGSMMEVPSSAVSASAADASTATAPSSGDAMQEQVQPLEQTRIEDYEYRFVFNNCSVGMAVASMGGAFIDCNKLFCKLSNYSKQEISSLTIFNLTARQDLQHAFDLISRLISPSGGVSNTATPQPVVLRGAMNNGNDLGLSVTLVKADDGIAKCFCVTLIKNPTSPFDDARPIPATIELVYGDGSGVVGASGGSSLPTTRQAIHKDGCSASLESAPAFTSG